MDPRGRGLRCFCALPFSSSCHNRLWKDFGVLFDPFAQLVGTCTVQTFPLATPHIIQLSHPEKGGFLVCRHGAFSSHNILLLRFCFFFNYAVTGLGSALCSAVLSSLPSYILLVSQEGPCISFGLHSFDVTCARLTMDWLYCRVPLASRPPKPMRLKLTLQNHQSRLLEAQLRLEMCPCRGR